MHTSQVPTLVNIPMRNETWLYNTTRFIYYTSLIYDRSVKGFYAQAKARCFEESKVVFKFKRYSYNAIHKNDTCDKKTKKILVVIHHYLFTLFTFENHNLKNNNLDTQCILILKKIIILYNFS
jgi:hypothetical protein